MAEAEVDPATWEEWLKSRPPAVAAMARLYPPGTRLLAPDGGEGWVISYREVVLLGVSAINPKVDYDGSLASRQYVTLDELGLPEPEIK